MNRPFRCTQCGKAYPIPDRLVGRKARCPACGRVQRIPALPASSPSPPDDLRQAELEEYPLVEVTEPVIVHLETPRSAQGREERVAPRRRSRPIHWRRLFHASALESSVLERESTWLIILSAADLLVTYALLRRGPSFYESNPVAQWFFSRWNIAGMTVFKFSLMGLVIIIGEVVERHRPGWGRALLAASCLATAVVVWYGLRLLFGYGHDGVARL
jgi:predicted  nucleic acid-binding Zn-ribbon protein